MNLQVKNQKTYRIAITGIGGTESPLPGGPIAQALRSGISDVYLIGILDFNVDLSYLAYDCFDEFFTLPPVASRKSLEKVIMNFSKAMAPTHLIPTRDLDVLHLIPFRKLFQSLGIELQIPSKWQWYRRRKDRLAALSHVMDLKVPPYRIVDATKVPSHLSEFASSDVVIKGLYRGAKVGVRTQELCLEIEKAAQLWGPTMIIQQQVFGDEWAVTGLGDGEGSGSFLFSLKKINMTTTGKVKAALSIPNEALFRAANSFLKVTQWRGPFEIEFIVHGEAVYLIEINPRFPGWINFSAGLGLNLPVQLVTAKDGKIVQSSRWTQPKGKMFVRFCGERIIEMSRMLDRKLLSD